jgi:hypothetical protein
MMTEKSRDKYCCASIGFELYELSRSKINLHKQNNEVPAEQNASLEPGYPVFGNYKSEKQAAHDDQSR